MTEWLDISSAPKDGTSILVGAIDVTAKYVDQAEWDGGDWVAIGGKADVGNLLGYLPTHWMPLPVLPGDDDCRSEERPVSSPSAASRNHVADLQKALAHIFPDKSGHFFICGQGGDLESDGLPNRVYLCPVYGSDHVAAFERVTPLEAE